jgi:hypothetical protein
VVIVPQVQDWAEQCILAVRTVRRGVVMDAVYTVGRAAVSIFLLAVTSSACSRGSQDRYSDPVEERAVLAELEQYYSDFSSRDWEAYAGHFWPGADLTTVWQPAGEDEDRVIATTIDDFISQAPQGPGSREIFEERMIEAHIRIFNNLAQAWVRYGMRFGDPGEVAEWEGVDAFALLKHGGSWRIASLVFSSEGS